jgi:hypothetical protein
MDLMKVTQSRRITLPHNANQDRLQDLGQPGQHNNRHPEISAQRLLIASRSRQADRDIRTLPTRHFHGAKRTGQDSPRDISASRHRARVPPCQRPASSAQSLRVTTQDGTDAAWCDLYP